MSSTVPVIYTSGATTHYNCLGFQQERFPSELMALNPSFHCCTPQTLLSLTLGNSLDNHLPASILQNTGTPSNESVRIVPSFRSVMSINGSCFVNMHSTVSLVITLKEEVWSAMPTEVGD